MKRYDLITPEGTRDLLFEGCLARRMVEDRLSKLFEGFGYSEVVTPGIEFYDLFMGSSRNFQQESLYKLTDSKGRLIVMRPDSTIPIARLASTRLKGAKLPLRLYYNQSIFENNSLLKGRSDEVVQAGIELIGGENSKRADYEVLCTAVEALSSFDKENFRLEIGHIGYFKEVGDNQVTNALRQLPRLFGGVEVFDKAADIYTDDKITGILYNLKEVYTRLSSLGYEGKISVDLGIVSHADYYTGIVFKGYLSEVGQSVLKGGRYDRLLAEFGNDCPAVGFGISVDSVARHIEKLGGAPKLRTPDAVVFGEKGYVVEAMEYAQTLVREGLTVENSLFNTLDETKTYAKSKGIKKLVVVGSEITELDI